MQYVAISMSDVHITGKITEAGLSVCSQCERITFSWKGKTYSSRFTVSVPNHLILCPLSASSLNQRTSFPYTIKLYGGCKSVYGRTICSIGLGEYVISYKQTFTVYLIIT